LRLSSSTRKAIESDSSMAILSCADSVGNGSGSHGPKYSSRLTLA
jgi:hypothetical protein